MTYPELFLLTGNKKEEITSVFGCDFITFEDFGGDVDGDDNDEFKLDTQELTCSLKFRDELHFRLTTFIIIFAGKDMDRV